MTEELKIGDTLYRFDVNRRKYTKPEPGRSWGNIIYAEHFEPLKIVGENRISWLLEHGFKANKKRLGKRGGVFTAKQMEDDIWANDHRHRIRDLVDHASPEHLREIARILGYKP